MKLTTKIIADKVIEVTGCNIRHNNRERGIVEGRIIYARLCKLLAKSTKKVIGKEIGKDHSTIIHYDNCWYDDEKYSSSMRLDFNKIYDLYSVNNDVSNLKDDEVRELINSKDLLSLRNEELTRKLKNIKARLKWSDNSKQNILEKNLSLNLRNKDLERQVRELKVKIVKIV